MKFEIKHYLSIFLITLSFVNPIFAQKKRVNILFLMSDQHRGDAIGRLGIQNVYTPNIDQLSREGILFTNGYSSVPSCTPARAEILTGMSPWKNGLLGYNNIGNYKIEGPKIMTENGYRTHAIGKNHFTPMRNKHGYQTVELEEGWYTTWKGHEKCDYTIFFEENTKNLDINGSGLNYTDHRGGRWFPYVDSLHPTHWTAQRAINFLKSYKSEAPWLLKVSFQRPHPPFDPPKYWHDFYQNREVKMPLIGEWAKDKYGQKIGSLETNPSASSGVFPDSEIEASKRSYFAGLSYVDEQIGRIIQELKERGEYENTLIIYTSDHGDMMGDNHIWRKCRPYEGSAKIPFIVHIPKSLEISHKRGELREELVELRDVFPTILNASNIPIPSEMDGKSILDIFRKKTWRKTLDLEHSQVYEPDNAWTAITDGKYKYIYYTLTGSEQLFFVKKDPFELTELVKVLGKNNKKVDKYRNLMIEHLRERGTDWVQNDQLVIQKKSYDHSKNFPSEN